MSRDVAQRDLDQSGFRISNLGNPAGRRRRDPDRQYDVAPAGQRQRYPRRQPARFAGRPRPPARPRFPGDGPDRVGRRSGDDRAATR